MFFNNILDDLVDICIYYYKSMTNNNIDGTVVNFLYWKIQDKIKTYQYHMDEIETINVSFNGYDDYTISSEDFDYQTPYLIKQYIKSHMYVETFDRANIVNPLEFNISLNVCPFEGLTIDSSFVISVCNCMVY